MGDTHIAKKAAKLPNNETITVKLTLEPSTKNSHIELTEFSTKMQIKSKQLFHDGLLRNVKSHFLKLACSNPSACSSTKATYYFLDEKLKPVLSWDSNIMSGRLVLNCNKDYGILKTVARFSKEINIYVGFIEKSTPVKTLDYTPLSISLKLENAAERVKFGRFLENNVPTTERGLYAFTLMKKDNVITNLKEPSPSLDPLPNAKLVCQPKETIPCSPIAESSNSESKDNSTLNSNDLSQQNIMLQKEIQKEILDSCETYFNNLSKKIDTHFAKIGENLNNSIIKLETIDDKLTNTSIEGVSLGSSQHLAGSNDEFLLIFFIHVHDFVEQTVLVKASSNFNLFNSAYLHVELIDGTMLVSRMIRKQNNVFETILSNNKKPIFENIKSKFFTYNFSPIHSNLIIEHFDDDSEDYAVLSS